jgi:hypothetical protein
VPGGPRGKCLLYRRPVPLYGTGTPRHLAPVSQPRSKSHIFKSLKTSIPHTSSSLANFSLSHLPISLGSNRYPPHPTMLRNIMQPSIALFLACIYTVAGAVSTNLPAPVHKFPCHLSLTNETLHPLPICSDIVLENGTLPLDMLCIEHVKNIENSEIVPRPSGCTNLLFDQHTSAAQMPTSRLPMRFKVRCASSQSEMSLLSNLGISNGARYLSSLLMWNIVQCTQLKLIQRSGATEKAHVHNGTM